MYLDLCLLPLSIAINSRLTVILIGFLCLRIMYLDLCLLPLSIAINSSLTVILMGFLFLYIVCFDRYLIGAFNHLNEHP